MKNFCLALAILLLSVAPADAQKAPKKVNLVHAPSKATDLPAPGAPLTISVTLENTRSSKLKVIGFFTRDGKLMEKNLTDFSTNNRDQLVFSTSIFSPLAELNYQFVLLDGKNVVATSRRYVVRRECIPIIDSLKTDPTDVQGNEAPTALQNHATVLQNEVNNLESALNILEELRELTEN